MLDQCCFLLSFKNNKMCASGDYGWYQSLFLECKHPPDDANVAISVLWSTACWAWCSIPWKTLMRRRSHLRNWKTTCKLPAWELLERTLTISVSILISTWNMSMDTGASVFVLGDGRKWLLEPIIDLWNFMSVKKIAELTVCIAALMTTVVKPFNGNFVKGQCSTERYHESF